MSFQFLGESDPKNKSGQATFLHPVFPLEKYVVQMPSIQKAIELDNFIALVFQQGKREGVAQARMAIEKVDL